MKTGHTISPASDFDTDTEINIVRSNQQSKNSGAWKDFLVYLLIGAFFGFVLIKTEVVSWYRIQEMFRLQSFHMYGVIGSALAVGMFSVWLIKKFHLKTVRGEEIDLPRKPFHKGQIFGGLIFGFGWALTGACPGPLYALIGAGFSVMVIALLSALVGTWVYARVQHRLPH